ncbi:MAG: TRAP transporter TatT component family protein [Thermodesulfobacteriota bacterium]|nr:TRAP transporter TatT component family protein [Thermodesulfobacteriota bacterium]
MTLTMIKDLCSPRGFRISLVLLLALGSGCGPLRRVAVRNVAGVFCGPCGGSNVFVEDNDPELIRDALPFALKTYEALLAADAQNWDLHLNAAEAFVTYANLFVHEEAQRLEELDFKRAQYLEKRATKLYLRGRDYALAGLTLHYTDFEGKLRADPCKALHALSPKDVPLLFWAAAGWAGAISTGVDNMSLVAELPMVEAMMRRALALDEDFEDGVIHEFFITYEGSRSEAMGASAERAMEHFHSTLEITGGAKAWPFVALASSVAVRKQDYSMFENLLNKALAVDVDAVPRWRLSNTLAQEKAQWLLNRSAALFLDVEENK